MEIFPHDPPSINLAAGAGDQGTVGDRRQVFRDRVMGRALIGDSGFRGSPLPRPLGIIGQAFAAFWHEMTRDMGSPYRPERHYMRGPGPKYRAKHGLPRA